jgi:hypothetical protein
LEAVIGNGHYFAFFSEKIGFSSISQIHRKKILKNQIHPLANLFQV